MNYNIAKYYAQLFANERSINVYIAKSNLTEDYCLLFNKKPTPTPHFKVVETVTPCITLYNKAESEGEQMTDEQKELVYEIQLSIVRAIVNMDPEKTWELIEKILENNGYVEEG